MDKKNKARKVFIITMNIIFAFIYTFLIGDFLYLWGVIRLVDGLMIVYFYFLFIALIVLGVVVLAFHYYSSIHPLIDKKKQKKSILILAISLVVISVASITGIEIKHLDLSTYSREKWLERGYDRGRMVKSFMKQVDLVGKTEEDVIYYLGEPDYEGKPGVNDNFSFSYNYNIGFYFDFMDPSTFDVYFNEDRLITSASIGIH